MLIKGLKVKLNNKLILDDVTLHLKSGINLILGPNGSGKTTLLRTIIGMLKPYEGEVKVNENLSYSPSEFHSPSIKVKDVIYSGKKQGEYEKFVKILHIENLLNRDFSTLSSGEKRKVILAKALGEGDLIIMDEPLSNLDISSKRTIIEIINSLKSEKQFLVTSHELELINYADNIIILKNGKVVYQGDRESLDEDLISRVYEVPIKKVFIDNLVFYIPY